MKYGIALSLALVASTAFAQSPAPQPPDPAFLQQAVQSLQAQRNEAMDRAAISDANHRMALQEAEKLKGALQKAQTELDAEKAKNTGTPPVAQKK